MKAISRAFASAWVADARNLLLELGDALLELGFLPEPGGAPELEQPLLGRHHPRHFRITGLVHQRCGEGDRVQCVALGGQAGLAGLELVEPAADNGEVRAQHRFIEAHEDVAGRDLRALPDPDLADDAAALVLNLLGAAVDDQHAGGDHRAGDLGERRPGEDPADAQERRAQRGEDEEPHPFAGAAWMDKPHGSVLRHGMQPGRGFAALANDPGEDLVLRPEGLNPAFGHQQDLVD